MSDKPAYQDWQHVDREIRRSNWRSFAAGLVLATAAMCFVYWMGWW